MTLLNSYDINQANKDEVKARWGHTSAYKEYEEKNKNYSKQQWNDLAEGMDQIMEKFSVCMKQGETSDSDVAQKLVKMLQEYISENYYNCTNEILAGLGQMYVADERFRNNIDIHADGTAEFIREAIEIHTKEMLR